MKVLESENKVFIRKQDCWSPYLQTMIDNQLNDCEVCAEKRRKKNNHYSQSQGMVERVNGTFKKLTTFLQV